MYNEIASIILKLVFAVISVVVTTVVVPWIKNTLTPWLKHKHLYAVVKSYVQAAEKIAESGLIEKVDKKSYVVGLLTHMGINVTSDIDALIESAVKELDIETGKILSQIGDAIVEDETETVEGVVG